MSESLINDMTPLLIDHKDEICLHQDYVLNPDWETYLKLEPAGMLNAYTARQDGNLIGYALYVVSYNMHYKDVLEATQDVLYLKPGNRGAFIGIALIKYADEQLAKDGVRLVRHHVKVDKDFSPLLERLGYTQSEKIYERRLD